MDYIIDTTVTDQSNPGHPLGAGGKNTRVFNVDNDQLSSTEEELRVASSLVQHSRRRADLNDNSAVVKENLMHADHNLKRANQRLDENYIEDVSEDKAFLDEFADQTVKSSVPHYIIDTVDYIGSLTPTTKAQVHIPLTLLTLTSLQRIHEDPGCVKMKKGLVSDDPKLFVMDTSASFPPETSLPPHLFYEAALNFLRLLKVIADNFTVQWFKEHCNFCLSRDEIGDRFNAVLAFDIEVRRKFFNTHTFFSQSTYLDRWKDMKINTSLANTSQQQNSSSSCYQPYPSRKPEGSAPAGSSNNGKPFRRSKGDQSTEHLLCIICGRLGHRASSCTHTHTAKNNPIVSMWAEKLVLKSSMAPICISFNIGCCNAPRHSADVVHVCSICGSKGHGANSKSCC
ncbi:hypothetical protein EDB19DRAFT_1964631 [Suillus lakei]|nr:hypothetical protein EDB19DRAFT_1964631 [Suillus lakei]